MNYLVILLIAAVLLGIAFLGLAIQIIFKKSHKFPNMHVGSNKNFSQQGITCAQTWDKMEQKKGRTIKVEGLKLKGN